MTASGAAGDAFTLPGGTLPDFAPGSVWLVGVGPGDPALLTLLGLHAIRTADLVVYDALVDGRILDLVPAGAQVVYAGKRGGRPSHDQADITDRLIAFAREGKRVARLKGGDPYVFARGGEEALGLVAAGIPFRVVPGITAGIGGLAAAGIPLTHRDTNASVAFVTGHDSSGSTPVRFDWDALARGAEVLVIYMPLGRLAEIADRLIAAGRPRDEPVAVVSRATTPEQAVLETSLARAAEDVAAAGLGPPAIVVVGPTVAFRARLGHVADPRAGEPARDRRRP